MLNKERRNRFTKIRKTLLKEHHMKELICARCGKMSKSTHLHHIKPIIEDGDDSPYNLIPLCHTCHGEWDYYEPNGVKFGSFLVTPNISMQIAMLKTGAVFHESFNLKAMELLYSTQFYGMAMRYEIPFEDYRYELEKQNAVFNQYPYSDHYLMFMFYGKVFKGELTKKVC